MHLSYNILIFFKIKRSLQKIYTTKDFKLLPCILHTLLFTEVRNVPLNDI